MFEGEKTSIFWIGLIILGISSMSLFSAVWFDLLTMFRSGSSTGFLGISIEYQVPFIVAAIVFIIIGLYMMKFGVKRRETDSRKTKLL